jgi:preprotein translocase subunit SecE
VADKDEAESTEESSAALPTDARDDTAAESAGPGGDDVRPDETVDFDETVDSDEPADSEPTDELTDPATDDGSESADRPEAGESDADEFDAIVRNSGVHDPNDPGAEDGDAKVLEPAGVAATAAGGAKTSERPAARTPKGTPTSKRDQPAKREPRTTPVRFVRQSVGELRKVVYPTGEQLIKYFVVVLVFVLFIIGYVSLLDLGLGAGIFKLFS